MTEFDFVYMGVYYEGLLMMDNLFVVELIYLEFEADSFGLFEFLFADSEYIEVRGKDYFVVD